MTKSEALAQARVKFGTRATVEIDPPHLYPRLKRVHPNGEWSTFNSGEGKSWETALAQAEYKEMKRLGLWN